MFEIQSYAPMPFLKIVVIHQHGSRYPHSGRIPDDLVRCFVGVYDFCRRHIHNFTYSSAPLTDLIKENTP